MEHILIQTQEYINVQYTPRLVYRLIFLRYEKCDFIMDILEKFSALHAERRRSPKLMNKRNSMRPSRRII
jgi:hypothetical protein